MATTTDPFKETIQAHLQEVAQTDKLFAETLKKPNKTIDGCINYIYSEVKKTGRCGWKDEEVFNMAIHYYDEDSIKDVPEVQRPQVSHTPKPTAKVQTAKPKQEPVKMPVAKKEASKTSKTVLFQPSLFD